MQYKKLTKDFSLTNFLTLVAKTEPGTSEWAKLYGEYYLGEVRRRMPNSQPGASHGTTMDLVVDNEMLDDFLLSPSASEIIYEILSSNNEEKMAVISVFHRYIIDSS